MHQSEQAFRYFDNPSGYEAIANPRRLHLLRVLDEEDSTMSLEALAEEIAKREREDDADSIDQSEIEQIVVSLHHVHAPKLDSANFVEYDMAEREVTLTPRAPLDAIESLVR